MTEDVEAAQASELASAFSHNARVYIGALRDLDEGEIRLLRLEPGPPGSLICIELFKTGLHDAPEYIALSYVWGPPQAPDVVQCNGERFLVTRSLHSALQRLRSPDSAKLIWADAIVINQLDLEERSRQVELMFEIFRTASEVRAWMQLPKPLDQEFLDWLRLLDNELPPLMIWMDDLEESVATAQHDPLVIKHAELLSRLLRESEVFRVAFYHVLTAEWYFRVWIQQEATANPKLVIMIEDFETPWENICFCHFLWLVMIAHYDVDFSKAPPNVNDARNLVSGIVGSRLLLQKAPTVRFKYNSLSGTCFNHRYARAKDDRDRVFAILNLITDVEQMKFVARPDYSLSYRDVALDTVRATLDRYPYSLDILNIAGRLLQRKEWSDWPSWVPDFGCTEWTWFKSMCYRRPNGGARISTYLRTGQKVLICHGHTLGHIKAVARPRRSDEWTLAKLKAFFTVVNSIFDEVHRLRPKTAQAEWNDVVGYCTGPFNHDLEETAFAQGPDLEKMKHFVSEQRSSLSPWILLQSRVNQQMCVASGGFFASVPLIAQPGDIIAEILGCTMPLVLRPVDGFSELIGKCQVPDDSSSGRPAFPIWQYPDAWQATSCNQLHYLAMSLRSYQASFWFCPGWLKLQSFEESPQLPDGYKQYSSTRLPGIGYGETQSSVWSVDCYHEETLQSIHYPPDGTQYDPKVNPMPLPPGWFHLQTLAKNLAEPSPDRNFGGRNNARSKVKAKLLKYLKPSRRRPTVDEITPIEQDQSREDAGFVHPATGYTLHSDPRYTDFYLGPVINDWVVTRKMIDDVDRQCKVAEICFVNTTTGQHTFEDPCLAQGVDLTNFHGFRII